MPTVEDLKTTVNLTLHDILDYSDVVQQVSVLMFYTDETNRRLH